MTWREKVSAYRRTESYRRLTRRVSILIGLWVVASFVIMTLPAPVVPLPLRLEFCLGGGVLMWLGLRLVVLLLAGVMSDERLAKHLAERPKTVSSSRDLI